MWVEDKVLVSALQVAWEFGPFVCLISTVWAAWSWKCHFDHAVDCCTIGTGWGGCHRRAQLQPWTGTHLRRDAGRGKWVEAGAERATRAVAGVWDAAVGMWGGAPEGSVSFHPICFGSAVQNWSRVSAPNSNQCFEKTERWDGESRTRDLGGSLAVEKPRDTHCNC